MGSYATQILRKGAEIRDVADILGHRESKLLKIIIYRVQRNQGEKQIIFWKR